MIQRVTYILAKVLFFGGIMFYAFTAVSSLRAEINRLTVDHRSTPVFGTDSGTPLFGWEIETPSLYDVKQTGYSVQLAAAAKELDENPLWTSGPMKSDQTQEISYAGEPLASSTRYFWRVTVRYTGHDASGNVVHHQESADGYFVTGILAPEDWTGSWITMERTDTDPLPLFEKEFALEKPAARVDTAYLHLCGLGQHAVRVNGVTPQATGELAPGWTNYRKTCEYATYDLTQILTESNEKDQGKIAVLLGNGMYNVAGGRYTKFVGSFGPPKMIAQLVIHYDDGSTQKIVSDESWSARFSPMTFDCVYGGEDRTIAAAHSSTESLFAPSREGEKIDNAKIADSPGGVLRAREEPAVGVRETRQPIAVRTLPDGRIEADFGFNFSGRPVIRGRNGRGALAVTLAEMKEKPWNGHLYTFNFAPSDANETFTISPLFTYWGFQYIYLDGAHFAPDFADDSDKTADDGKSFVTQIEADWISALTRNVGSFDSDGPWLNEIYAMINRSIRSNMVSILTDCPHREKLGWLEQTHLMAPSIMYNDDIQTLLRKMCRDMSEAQLDDGMIPDIAPEYTRFSAGFLWSAEWSSAAIQVPWFLYKWYGDKEIISRQYETMDRYLGFMAGTRDDAGLVRAGLGDWYDWSVDKGHFGRDGYSQHTPGELTATAFFYDNARKMAKFARLLNRTDDEKRYTKLTEEAQRDFLKAYYNPETHVVATGSQAAYAFALYFQLVPAEDRPAVLENLLTEIKTWEYRQSTGEVAFRFLVQTLADSGRSDVLWKMIQRENAPGYVHMLKHWGMKTLSETWDGPGSSMNHFMFGHIQEWLTGRLVGIGQTDDSIAFKEIRLRPEPVSGEKKLTRTEGSYHSIAGRIESAWKIENGEFRWQFTIPANTTAQVEIPVVNESSPYSIFRIPDEETSVPVMPDKLTFLDTDHGNPARVAVHLGSGHYEVISATDREP